MAPRLRNEEFLHAYGALWKSSQACDALKGFDLDAVIDLSDVLEARRIPERISTFVLQLLFELLPGAARGTMAAAGVDCPFGKRARRAGAASRK
jgi:hypothetical protein